jgi:hypothetical protein
LQLPTYTQMCTFLSPEPFESKLRTARPFTLYYFNVYIFLRTCSFFYLPRTYPK